MTADFLQEQEHDQSNALDALYAEVGAADLSRDDVSSGWSVDASYDDEPEDVLPDGTENDVPSDGEDDELDDTSFEGEN